MKVKGSKFADMRTGLLINAFFTLGSTIALPAHAETTISQLKSAYGQTLEVLGEIEQIDISNSVLVIAGQHIAISQETVVTYMDDSVSDSLRALTMFQIGDLVAVCGIADAPAKSIVGLKESYVAGATVIFVKGKIVSASPSFGIAKLGDLKIDFTPAISSENVDIKIGNTVEAAGIQPVAGGLLLADAVISSIAVIHASITASPDYIIGTSKAEFSSYIIGTSKAESSSYIIGASKAESPSYIIGTSKAESPSYIIGTSKAESPSYIIGTSKAESPSYIIGTSKAESPSYIIGTSKAESPSYIIGTSKAGSPSYIIGTSKAGSPSYIIGTSKAESPSYIIGTSKAGSPSYIIGTSKAASPSYLIGTS